MAKVRKRIDIFVEGIPGNPPRYKFEATDVEGKRLVSGEERIERKCTSAFAVEYEAAIAALGFALQFAMASVPVTLRVRSRTLMNYLKGKWPVRKADLLPLHRELSGLMASFSDIEVKLYAGGIGEIKGK